MIIKMKRMAFFCFFMMAVLLLYVYVNPVFASGGAIDLDKLYGPRVDRLCMFIIANPDSQVLAVETGEIDILGDISRPSDVERLARRPDLELSLARGFHAFFLLMNNRSKPWKDARVRSAAAQAVDRGGIVRMIFSGYSEPINTWLPPVSPWAAADHGQNRFNLIEARRLLEGAGYTWNLSGRLIAPDGAPVEKIKLLTPLARVAPTTYELAERVADSLSAVGFPVEVEPLDFSTMSSRLGRGDYSLAVLAWSMGHSPTSLYSFYHSSGIVEGGYNMTGTSDAELDGWLHALKFAPDRESAELASAEAQKLLERIVPSVPVYSRFSIAAASKKWKNVLTTPGMTADNFWTILAAEPRDGSSQTLNMLLAEEPRNLNPLVASSVYSWQVLGLIYETLVGTDPWTLENSPSLARSWEVTKETVRGIERTVLDFHLRDDVFWNDGEAFTASDVAATIEFIRDKKPPRFFDSAKNVETVEVRGDYHLTVYMNNVSYWQLNEIGGLPCLPKHVLDRITDWQTWDPTDISGQGGPYGLVGTGPFMFEEYRAGEYLMMVKNPRYRLLKNVRESGGEVWNR